MFLRSSKYNIIFIVQCISLTLLQGLDSTDGFTGDPLQVNLKIFFDNRTTTLDLHAEDDSLPISLTVDLDNKGDYLANSLEPEPYSLEKLETNTVALYYFPTSPACRAVIILGYKLGITLDFRPVEIYRKEHTTNWYTKMNPDQVVPTIMIDEDNIRSFQWESHEILKYLWEKFGKYQNEDLYPQSMKDKIDEMMELDKTLFEYFKKQYFNWIWQNEKYSQEYEDKIHEKLKELDDILYTTTFAAGDQFTLADISLYPTVTTYKALQIDFGSYTNINRWLNVLKNYNTINSFEDYIPLNYNDGHLMNFLTNLVKLKTSRELEENKNFDLETYLNYINDYNTKFANAANDTIKNFQAKKFTLKT